MPKPTEGESEQDFVSRFMETEEAQKDYPDQKQRAAVAYSLWRHRKNSKDDGWPKMYQCRYIEPGIVKYNEYGTVLVQKPVLDRMASTFVGKPVVNVVHRDINPKNFREEADGIVTRTWYNDADGWYWAEFAVWDPATQRNCESEAYSVSCAYNVAKSADPEGDYHNIKYDQEVIDAEYTHLAVVANPRYEGARIIYNSKEATMKLFKFWKKEDVKNVSEIDMDKAIVEIDGKEIPMKELIEAHNARAAAPQKISIDTIVDIDGKPVAVKDLVESFKNAKKNADETTGGESDELEKEQEEEKKRKLAAKNASEIEKAHKDGDHKEKDVENCPMCNELKNAEDKKHFDEMKKAANRRGEPQQPVLTSRRDQAEEGRKRYGTIQN